MDEKIGLISKVPLAIPAGETRLGRQVCSLLAGLVVAVILHYILYRIGLPSKPFIYVAF